MSRIQPVRAAFLAVIVLSSCSPDPWLAAPNPDAQPVNQLNVSGNACGPASLLNALRGGSEPWRRAADAVDGDSDREQMLTIIRRYGMKQTRHGGTRARWSRRGVHVADLADIANDTCAGHYLPAVQHEVFIKTPAESPERLLGRIHSRLRHSLERGLPPILSIRRHALRHTDGTSPAWLPVDAHFVTITGMDRRLPSGARSFKIQCIDPWRGKRLDGRIGIPQDAVFADAEGRPSCLEAVIPGVASGERSAKRGERSVVVASAAIGRW